MDTGLFTAVGVSEAVITAKSRDGSNILAACKLGVTSKFDINQDNSTSGDLTGDNTFGDNTTGGNTSGDGLTSGNKSGGSSTGDNVHQGNNKPDNSM